MSKEFSIDDILAEVDEKRGAKPRYNDADIDAILNIKDTRDSDSAVPGKASALGVTQILDGAKPSPEPVPETKLPPEPVSKPKHVIEKPRKPAADDIVYRKASSAPGPDAEDERLTFTKGKRKSVPAPAAELVPEPEPPSKANRGASISIGASQKPENDDDFDFPKLEITQVIEKPEKPEKPVNPIDKELERRGQSLLERDMSLEAPLEQIDALNPYDMMNGLSEKDSALSGDTLSIADGDLRVLARMSAENKSESTMEVVKTYKPAAENDDPQETGGEVLDIAANVGASIAANAGAARSAEKRRRSNTALIESLNKSLRKKRESDISAYRTLASDVMSGEDFNSEAPESSRLGLNINYSKQVLTDTSLPAIHEDLNIAAHKMKELAGKRKRKIRDFVLEDIEDDKNTDLEQADSTDAADAAAYDASGRIREDLNETHKGLRIRFILLLILTGFSVFLSFMNDMGYNMAYNILGADVKFLDKTWEPTGFLYLNLVIGILGILICSTVIRGGIVKLFTGKADCDSLCAVPAVISALSVVPMLDNAGNFSQGYVNIFVAAGLAGLFFNTAGKLMMMNWVKRNFKFTSGDSAKYFAEIIKDENLSRAFTKGALLDLPVLAGMRKTEFLSNFLKNSYCNDKADQLCRYLAPAAFGAALVVGAGTLLMPYENPLYQGNVFWALTTANAMLCLLSPLSIMFLVNHPLLRASKSLSKTDSVVLGYNAAEKFSRVNSVLVDASSLFPAGSFAFRNLKRCQPANSLNSFTIDGAIITAASLAIRSGSVLSGMFYDMINGKSELLHEIDNCIYEVNMGISGWMGNKRLMLGNREQMKHHGIKVPTAKKEQQYTDKFGDVVYLASGGETIAMFFLKIVPNEQVRESLQILQHSGTAIIVRTRDSLVTTNSLAQAFGLDPQGLRILPFDLHAKFDECTRYASGGDGGLSCSGTFSSFASALTAAKKIMQNIILSSSAVFIGLVLAVVFALIFTVFASSNMFTSTNVILYNGFFFLMMMIMQWFKRY